LTRPEGVWTFRQTAFSFEMPRDLTANVGASIEDRIDFFREEGDVYGGTSKIILPKNHSMD
jgi:hypothetical protein